MHRWSGIDVPTSLYLCFPAHQIRLLLLRVLRTESVCFPDYLPAAVCAAAARYPARRRSSSILLSRSSMSCRSGSVSCLAERAPVVTAACPPRDPQFLGRLQRLREKPCLGLTLR